MYDVRDFPKAKIQSNTEIMDKLIEYGKEMGLKGNELLLFVREQQEKDRVEKEKEREERAKQREYEKEERARQQEREETERKEKERKEEKEREEREILRLERIKQQEREDRIRQEEKEKEERIRQEENDKEERKLRFERQKHEDAMQLQRARLERNLPADNGEGRITNAEVVKPPKLPTFIPGVDKIDCYLERFERYAEISQWDRETWATRLSTLITGEALEVYTRLSRLDAINYEAVKMALLKRFNFTEEGYRQKFRDCKPETGETPSQFIERLQSYLEKWVEMADLKKEYGDLRNLILKEQFINACPADLAEHLLEQEATDLKNMAKIAERYLSAHHKTLSSGKSSKPVISQEARKMTSSIPSESSQVVCYKCNRPGHRANACRTGTGKKSWQGNDSKTGGLREKESSRKGPVQHRVCTVVKYKVDQGKTVGDDCRADQARSEELKNQQSSKELKHEVFAVVKRKVDHGKTVEDDCRADQTRSDELKSQRSSRERKHVDFTVVKSKVNHGKTVKGNDCRADRESSEEPKNQLGSQSKNEEFAVVKCRKGHGKTVKRKGCRVDRENSKEPTNQQSLQKLQSTASSKQLVDKECPEDRASPEELKNYAREGQVKLDNGKSIRLVDSAAVVKQDGAAMPVTRGYVDDTEVDVLRDTGCSGVIVKRSLIPPKKLTGEECLLLLADSSVTKVPIAKIEVRTPYYTGEVEAMCMSRPVYDLIIGNVEGARAADDPDPHYELKADEICTVTTRSQAKKDETKPLKVAESVKASIVDRAKLIELQKADKELINLMKKKKSPVGKKGRNVSFEEKGGIMYRVYQKNDVNHGKAIRQVLVPESLRKHVLKVAHDSIMGGHLGSKKTADKIQATFYWPGLLGDVTRFCRSCDTCQKTVPRGRVTRVPLQKMPLVDSPFKRVAIDLIGPITPASEEGHRYVLTLVDYATRYPEAVPLKKIDTETVAEALVDMFSRLGVPEQILSDLGTQFVSDCMEEVNRLLSIKHLTTTPYHPMCNGLVEKFNGTLKSMLKKLCTEQPRQWNRYINALLFAYREVPQESTGFSPFELLYGRTVRGPMHILKELWTNETDTEEVKNSYQYVFDLREKIEETLKIAREGLENAQKKSQHYYNKKAKVRKFKPNEKVLVLLPTDHNKLLMQWKGPYVVEEVVGLNDYKVKVGSKTKTFHANLLKLYVEREQEETEVEEVVASAEPLIAPAEMNNEEDLLDLGDVCHKETIHDVKYGKKLEDVRKDEISELAKDFSHLFDPRPGDTNVVEHPVKLTSSTPVCSKPYKIPYKAREELKKDIDEMLELGVIRESDSPYASPIVIVKKPDGSNRICVDYRKLNKLTVFDPEPMPTADELFQKLSGDRYFSKVDLSKGYWQIRIPENDIPKTAFVTPDGHYEFLRMPFGMVNSGATLKKGMKKVLRGLKNVEYYWDDILVHTPTWEEHLVALRELFQRLSEAHLTIRPSKCILGTDNVDFIGHRLSEGLKGLHESNVEKIKAAPRPKTKSQVRSFMGLANYYREFIPNFAAIAAPLTDLTRKGSPINVKWEEPQEKAYQTIRNLLSQDPVLHIPDPAKTFVLRTDASDEGIGAVLLQEFDGKFFPVSYASKRLSPAERNYSVIEKECLAIVWAVRKYELYLQGVKFVLQTDHHPLRYLDSAKFLNTRVMRWALFLQNFNMRIDAIPGKLNIGADFLSRAV